MGRTGGALRPPDDSGQHCQPAPDRRLPVAEGSCHHFLALFDESVHFFGKPEIGFGGRDAANGERDSDGYLVQATYKVGNTKFGVNYGSSTLDATAADRTANAIMLEETNQMVLGVYHNLTPSLTIAGEYITREEQYRFAPAGTPKGEENTIAVGAILFF